MKAKTLVTVVVLLVFSCVVIFQYGCNRETKNVKEPPVASFIADKTQIKEGETINFTDQSTNITTGWNWDFGDGRTSTTKNPSHTYDTTGAYDVSLTASNSYGSDIEIKTDYITVSPLSTNEACTGTPTVTDYDGNTYNTVKIGNQCWMKENLKTTHYSDGTEIPLVESSNEWGNLTQKDKAYCFYDNNSANANTYGALYTWTAAMNGASSSGSNPSFVQGVCPTGWHLPSDTEWRELWMALGMTEAEAYNELVLGTNEGSELSGNASLWNDGKLENDPEFGTSGFLALPGGNRIYNGQFDHLMEIGYWWTATENSNSDLLARIFGLNYDETHVFTSYPHKDHGMSVRCIKD